MFLTLVNSKALFTFPDSLVKTEFHPAGTKRTMARIRYLYTNSYGVKDPGDKDKPENLEKLVTQAYLPYLERCCRRSEPLVHMLDCGIGIAHGGIQRGKEKVNEQLNAKYCAFIQGLPRNRDKFRVYSREELQSAGLFGTFYTKNPEIDRYEIDHSILHQARQIKCFSKLADKSATEAVSSILGLVNDEYKGPIVSHFYELKNGTQDQELIGICGHSPLGQLPMVYQNNLCCDTTYALGGPLARPAMHIQAHLESHTSWEITVTLKTPITATDTTATDTTEIHQYSIRHDTMLAPPDVTDGDNNIKIYEHYVGTTPANHSIWRRTTQLPSVEVRLPFGYLKPEEEDFWKIVPEYILKPVDSSTAPADINGKKYTIISDIEGNKLFFEESLALENLALANDVSNTLVLLGDTWDRGSTEDEEAIWNRIRSEEKEREVITIVGNRDANKVRWICELHNDFDILQ